MLRSGSGGEVSFRFRVKVGVGGYDGFVCLRRGGDRSVGSGLQWFCFVVLKVLGCESDGIGDDCNS